MLQALYNRLMGLAGRPGAAWWLAGVSFAESSFLPLPPDPLLLAMAMARPDRAWRLAAIATVASVAGGLLGYAIGYAAFDLIGRPLLHAFHYEEGFARFKSLIDRYGFWIIMAKGVTPIPFKVVAIGSGVLHYDLGLFVLASVITRGARFLLIAAVLRAFGQRAREFVERRLALLLSGGLLLAALGVAMVIYL